MGMQLGAFSLHELELLLLVLETGSLSGVAEHCHVSVSKLSKLVRAVEDALGGALFARKGATLVITPQGVVFKRQLERAVHDAAALTLEDRSTSEQLAVAFDPLIAQGLAPLPLTSDVARLQVLTISSEYAGEFASQGTYDLGFFLGPIASPPHWHSAAIGEVTFSFVRTHPTKEAACYVFLGLLSRQGLVRRRLLPPQFHAPSVSQIDIGQVELLRGVLREQSCIVCLPRHLQRVDWLGEFEPVADAVHPSFTTTLVAVCDDQRIQAHVFRALCQYVASAM